MSTEELHKGENVRSLLFSLFVFMTLPAIASEKMLLVGDSWAVLMCLDASFNHAFQKQHVDARVDASCLLTAEIGMRAERWMGSSLQKRTDKIMKKYRDVGVVYLSLGGNDFINHWNKNLTSAEEDVEFQKIKQSVKSVIDHIHSILPQAKILLSGYDFGRFVDHHPIKAYQKAFEGMGKPAPQEIHTAILRLSKVLNELRDDQSIFYIQHYGLGHFYVGNKEGGLQPGVTLNPDEISNPRNPNQSGGDPNLLQPPSVMLHIGRFLVDAFHLSAKSFDRVAEHSVSLYLKYWFQPKQ